MKFLSQIIQKAPAFLSPGGELLLEIDDSLAEKTTRQLVDAGYLDVVIHRDWAGLRRIAQARFGSMQNTLSL
jgi:methylase of polypeptide subunit release factors